MRISLTPTETVPAKFFNICIWRTARPDFTFFSMPTIRNAAAPRGKLSKQKLAVTALRAAASPQKQALGHKTSEISWNPTDTNFITNNINYESNEPCERVKKAEKKQQARIPSGVLVTSGSGSLCDPRPGGVCRGGHSFCLGVHASQFGVGRLRPLWTLRCRCSNLGRDGALSSGA